MKIADLISLSQKQWGQLTQEEQDKWSKLRAEQSQAMERAIEREQAEHRELTGGSDDYYAVLFAVAKSWGIDTPLELGDLPASEFRRLVKAVLQYQRNEKVEPPGNARGSGGGRRKRRKAGSKDLTNAQEVMAAAIRSWHRYDEETLSCGRCDPIGYSKLLELSRVLSKATPKKFFDQWFEKGGNVAYKRLCKSGDAKALAVAIAKLSRTGALAVVQFTAEALADVSTSNRLDD